MTHRTRPCFAPAALALLAGLAFYSPASHAATRSVGPGKAYAKPCAAIATAVAGDIIEIDAAGSYAGDVCAIPQSNLTLRGVNGRARIDAAGKNYGGKGIWVISGSNVTVENIEFSGATVPDRNGAGIRSEGSGLTIRNSYFHHNENGILTAAIATSDILIENSEFAFNGYGDGQSHNMYIGKIRSFTLRGSYSHDANVGHLVKSRAEKNTIAYNRLSNKETGNASYEINLPNAGSNVIVGNIIHQSPSAGNSILISVGEEGVTNAASDLYVVNNTMINDRSSGYFVKNTATTPAVIRNNAFLGPGTILTGAGTVEANNKVANISDFVDPNTLDMHLRLGSPLINAGAAPGATSGGVSLAPISQYRHPSQLETRPKDTTYDVGAYEYGTATASPSPSPTVTASPSPSPTVSPSPTPTPSPSPTPTSTGTVDTTKPTTKITSPVNWATYPRYTTVTVSATAWDNVKVTKVEFYRDGVLRCTDTTAPYSCSVSSGGTSSVSHKLQTRAYDAAGNVGISSIVNIWIP